LVWMAPFFFLAACALPGRRLRAPLSPHGLVLLVGPLPLLLDVVALLLRPQGHRGHELVVLLAFAAFVGVGGAVRIALQDARDKEAQARDEARAEEERRATRLALVSSLSDSLLGELAHLVERLAARVEAAAATLGAEAGMVRGQVERARAIVG